MPEQEPCQKQPEIKAGIPGMGVLLDLNARRPTSQAIASDEDVGKLMIVQEPKKQAMPRTIWMSYWWDADTMLEKIHALVSEDDKSEILIAINCPGGSIYELMELISIIKTCPVEVRTCVYGIAMSAAFVLATCGAKGKRFVMPYATGLIHEASSFTIGNINDQENEIEEVRRVNDLMLKIVAENCGKTFEEVVSIVRDGKSGDVFLSAEEMLELGAVDEMVTDFRKVLPVVVAQEGGDDAAQS